MSMGHDIEGEISDDVAEDVFADADPHWLRKQMGQDGSAHQITAYKKSIRAMPAQKPGQSKQDYGTPADFIAAVKKRFGIREFTYDLAASPENTKAKHFFCEEEDSLKQDWTKLRGDLWLNPPFANIDPWAEKCAASAFYDKAGNFLKCNRRIFFLTPLSSSNWFADHVDGKALVILLNGRLSFDGKAPYPKDCALQVFGVKSGYEVWRWRK